MPDGNKRPRRNGQKGEPRRKWYAEYRSRRFSARFGISTPATKGK
jgi:hypothetical protein